MPVAFTPGINFFPALDDSLSFHCFSFYYSEIIYKLLITFHSFILYGGYKWESWSRTSWKHIQVPPFPNFGLDTSFSYSLTLSSLQRRKKGYVQSGQKGNWQSLLLDTYKYRMNTCQWFHLHYVGSRTMENTQCQWQRAAHWRSAHSCWNERYVYLRD